MRRGHVAGAQVRLLAAQAGRLALYFVTLAVLGHAMAPGDFGFFLLVASLFVIVQEALDLGTSAVTVRAVARDPATERQRLATLLAWRRAGAAVAAVLAAGIAAAAFSGERRMVLLAAAAVIGCMGWTTYHLVFQLHHRWTAALVLALALQAGFLAAGAGAVALGAAGAAVALLVVLRELAQLVASRRIAAAMLGAPLQAPWRGADVAALLRDAWTYGVAALLYKLSAHAGAFAAWAVGTPEVAGDFGAAHRLVVPAIDLAALFVAPVAVLLARDAVQRPARVRRELGAMLECMAGAGAVLAVGAWATAPLLIDVLYAGRYAAPSQEALRVLGLGAAFAVATPILGVGLLAVGRERAVLAAAAAGLVANLALAGVAVPAQGAAGAAAATAAGQGVAFLLLVAEALRTGWVHARRGWVHALLPPLAMAAVVLPLARWPVLQVAAAAGAGLASLVALWSLPALRSCRAARDDEAQDGRDAMLTGAAT